MKVKDIFAAYYTLYDPVMGFTGFPPDYFKPPQQDEASVRFQMNKGMIANPNPHSSKAEKSSYKPVFQRNQTRAY